MKLKNINYSTYLPSGSDKIPLTKDVISQIMGEEGLKHVLSGKKIEKKVEQNTSSNVSGDMNVDTDIWKNKVAHLQIKEDDTDENAFD